jgi:hypothetical protein
VIAKGESFVSKYVGCEERKSNAAGSSGSSMILAWEWFRSGEGNRIPRTLMIGPRKRVELAPVSPGTVSDKCDHVTG